VIGSASVEALSATARFSDAAISAVVLCASVNGLVRGPSRSGSLSSLWIAAWTLPLFTAVGCYHLGAAAVQYVRGEL
jgi:hypothetical protein